VKILIVEDETSLREGLVDLIGGAGHQVDAVGDGLSAVTRGSEPDVDVVLLDLMLPGMNGLDVCRHLKEKRPELFILMLTARGSEDDKVNGLETGADDYITKPFGTRELLARLEAVGRRIESVPTDGTIEIGKMILDLGRLEMQRDGESTSLTPREVGILSCLFRHRGRAVSRAELLEKIWGAPGNLETRTVDMTISNLRQKIETDPACPEVVVTIKGVGYAWGPR
jgi:DNA-binding response OmpR family regulator